MNETNKITKIIITNKFWTVSHRRSSIYDFLPREAKYSNLELILSNCTWNCCPAFSNCVICCCCSLLLRPSICNWCSYAKTKTKYLWNKLPVRCPPYRGLLARYYQSSIIAIQITVTNITKLLDQKYPQHFLKITVSRKEHYISLS